MTKLEKLANQIMNECAKDGEPVTLEEATEMAKMELGSKEMLNYTQATVKKERKKVERKVDEDKASLINFFKTALENEDFIIDEGLVLNVKIKPETEINFEYCANEYTLKLIKHRPPKK